MVGSTSSTETSSSSSFSFCTVISSPVAFRSSSMLLSVIVSRVWSEANADINELNTSSE